MFETPPSCAQSLHDMLVQGYGGTIRVFPALPAAWNDVTVHDLRTEGAFLVSAARRGGVTRFRPRQRASPAGDGTIELDLRHDDDLVITTRRARPDLSVGPGGLRRLGPSWGLT